MTNNQLAENSVIQLLNSVRLARDNAERADNRVDHSFYYALTIALEELQERRKADSEPVAWTDEEELRDANESGSGYLFGIERDANKFADPRRQIMLYRHAQPAPERDQVRIAHAEWSQATFGNVGPVGPLKHLSKEALEAAAEPGDLSEWADMQFLLWDAQRRAGITDEQITQAMIEKLAVNKQREWPEPKDGEPRLHIKAQPAPEYPETLPCPVLLEPGMRFGKGVKTRLVLDAIQRRAEHYAELEAMSPDGRAAYDERIEEFKALLPKPVNASRDFDAWFNGPDAGLRVVNYHIQRELQESAWNACRAAMLQAQPCDDGEPTDDERIMAIEGIIPPISSGNSQVIPDGYVMVPKEPTEEMNKAGWAAMNEHDAINPTYRAMLAAAPQDTPALNSLQNVVTVSDTWIPVSERMPEDEQEVLTINRMGHRFVSFFDKHSGLFFDRIDAPAACCIEHVLVTHWMPLPAAPQEVVNGQD